MASPGNEGNESVNAGDGGHNLPGEDTTTAFQGTSPYQTAGGLEDVRKLTDNANGDKDVVHEVAWTDSGNETTQDIQRKVAGDSLSEMITGTRTAKGQSLDQLRAGNPALAAEVEKVAELLSKQTPDQMNETLKAMRELYKGYNGLSTDNSVSVAALREGKLNPEGVEPVFQKAGEVLKLAPEKRPQEYRNIERQLRLFYLD